MIGTDIFNGIAAGTIAVIACAVADRSPSGRRCSSCSGRGSTAVGSRSAQLGSGEDSRLWLAVVDRVLSAARSVAHRIGRAARRARDPSRRLARLTTDLRQPEAGRLAVGAGRIIDEFPRSSTPAIVVSSWPVSEPAAAARAAQRLETLAAARGVAHPPFSLGGSLDSRAVTLELPLRGSVTTPGAMHALEVLRGELIPLTLGRVPGVHVAVTGETAQNVDFTQQMRHGLPQVIGFVLVFGFLILLFTFRSVIVPIKAIVLNLLSVAASYGVLVLVFQHHWAEGLLGFHSTGWIGSWMPVFLFVVLFGLSMDYHVFILSRVREGLDNGMSNDARAPPRDRPDRRGSSPARRS